MGRSFVSPPGVGVYLSVILRPEAPPEELMHLTCAVAEAMVRAFLHKAAPGRLLKPRLLVSVPSGISEVAERAVVEAGLQAGARRVYLMEEPLAAALGAGIDIAQPEGHMVVDIGGGTTDVAVAALGGGLGDHIHVDLRI